MLTGDTAVAAPIRVRLSAAARRRIIVDEAILLVARAGFEGLKTREVALRVGINSATLHHHFNTKEDLVEEIGEELARRFRAHKPTDERYDTSSRAGVARQFEDALRYRRQFPDLAIVYAELVNRARRDDRVAEVVAHLDSGWLADIRARLHSGVETDDDRPDGSIEGTALVIFHALRSAMADPLMTDAAFRAMCDSLFRLADRD